MTGNAADLDRSMLYYYKVDKAFLTNDEVINHKAIQNIRSTLF